MPNLLIAHQLGSEFDEILLPHLPPGVVLRALPPDSAYEVPAEAEALIAVPARAGNIQVPAVKPEGWPRRLRWVQAISAGVDEYPSWLYEVPIVTCGRGGNSESIAEFVLASLLAVVKKFPETWIHSPEQWQVSNLGTLRGKTLGLLGFGSIAEAIAERALPFGMRVLAWRRSGAPSERTGVTVADLDTVLAEADHLVVTLPLTSSTRNAIGAEAFAKVKSGVHLVNVSRGAVIDHAALLEALEDGRIGQVSLDVTEPEPLPPGHPLYTHPRAHISPHVSFMGGGRAGVVDIILENLRRFQTGEALLNPVDPGLGY